VWVALVIHLTFHKPYIKMIYIFIVITFGTYWIIYNFG
jgi:hypothetical protein